MKIDTKEVHELHRRLREINAIPFDEIEWMDGERPIVVSPETREQWKFAGLSNCLFVDCLVPMEPSR